VARKRAVFSRERKAVPRRGFRFGVRRLACLRALIRAGRKSRRGEQRGNAHDHPARGEFTVFVDGKQVAQKGASLPTTDQVLTAVRKAEPAAAI
jgi:hypothetical protein